MSHPAFLVLCCSLLTAANVSAVAAGPAVTVVVSDAAGQPLAGAVAMLEPAGAKAVVRPMAPVSIEQRKRAFMPSVTVITAGTGVLFPNFDTVRHHVYSFSPIKTFELKLYAGVPNQPVVFEQPGIAVLGCNIHDQMAAWVVVSSTPWFGQTDAGGQTQIDGVPAGHYTLRVWHAGLAVASAPVDSSVQLRAGDNRYTVQLPVPSGARTAP